jgi:transposase-like protein
MIDSKDRIEVVSVVKRHEHRSWPEKARIVAEAQAPGATFAGVAARYGVQAAQIYTWRKQMRERAAEDTSALSSAQLIPVQLVEQLGQTTSQCEASLVSREQPGVVDVTIGNTVTVRISGHVSIATLAAVFGALKQM